MIYGLIKHKEKNPKNVVRVPSRKLAQLKHKDDNLNAQRYWKTWRQNETRGPYGSQRSRTDCHSKLEKINLSLYQNFEYEKNSNFCADINVILICCHELKSMMSTYAT